MVSWPQQIKPRLAARISRVVGPSLFRCSFVIGSLYVALPGLCQKTESSLPDSPGTLIVARAAVPLSLELSDTLPGSDGDVQAGVPSRLPSCRTPSTSSPEANWSARERPSADVPCQQENPVQPVVNSRFAGPLTPRLKARLAIRDVTDPFNVLTIAGYSAFAVAANAHSAYGPGLKGWGKLSGYSTVEDAQGEFFGTFLICSLAHEDPRYHRLPNAPLKRRVLHAVGHTFITAHDDGTRMPNYSTLLTYPISAELSNLYVPGVPTNLRDTAGRVGIGLATDPSGTLLAEFLPDIAKRIHIHVIFIQEILNQVVTGGTSPNVQ